MMSEELKNIFEPPEKVQKMYEALAAFVQEKKDITAVTVSDITSRAGIGKGTAYEYFSSKEELIVYATLWLSFQQIQAMAEGIAKLESFQGKFFYLLEWIEAHREYNELILKAMKGSFGGECEKIKSCMPMELAVQVRGYITGQINAMLEQGYQEGVFTEQNVEKRIIIFFGTLMQYGFGIMSRQEFSSMEMNEEQLKEFIYNCMIKALN